jgi:hypothetical protein
MRRCGQIYARSARLRLPPVLVARMKRALLLACGTVLFSSCDVTDVTDVTDDRISAAAIFVVKDLVSRAPPGLDPQLLRRWEVPPAEAEPVPADLLEIFQEVSGFPIAPGDVASSRDSSIVLLHMYRPLVLRGDSVRVLGGWIRLVGGDGGGAWGTEYDYLLDCRLACRLLEEPRESVWN